MVAGLLAFLTLLFDLGFEHSIDASRILDRLYLFFLLFITLYVPFRYILSAPVHQKLQVWVTDGILFAFYLLVFLSRALADLSGRTLITVLENKIWLVPVFTFFLIRELSRFDFWFRNKKINPALLFVSSFFSLILVGTFLLMMPRATHSGISFTDAFFTSTSAVCVTGLIVVDTGTYFTQFGQVVIIILVQLGGLGIMTFTSFFVFFFSGGTSFHNMIVIGNVTHEKKLARVFSTLWNIVIFTFLLEAVGMILIYLSLDQPEEMVPGGKIFFSLFHAVSGFCNSGFSTLSHSLHEISFRFNYPLHLVIAMLFIIGGLGFPVITNIYNYLRHLFHKSLRWLDPHKRTYHLHIISLNTRIVLLTTLILIVAGTIAFYLLEYHNTLSGHSGGGKLATAFFSAVTPRTAGFNSVDTGSLHLPTMIMVILLMWIGASPGSTGGGVKTSTFALSVLNVISLARGRNRVEFFNREIPNRSLKRASAFIILSFIMTGSAIFVLLLTDPGKSFSSILFEVFSAFSTVGLSRGITGDLSVAGKYVIIFTMFTGRVGTLTLLVAFFRKPRSLQYRYPSEDILIN